MTCEVEFTNEFDEWWNGLTEGEQESVESVVDQLEHYGTTLAFPYSGGVKGSKYKRMRELRIQHAGDPYRVLYIFDPRRITLLLIGGNKAGDDRWYEKYVPLADKIYAEHLETLKKEAKENGS